MTQALAKVEQQPQSQWSPADIELIKQTVAKGANPEEFKLFLYIAQRYNLDPLVKQIWLIKYGQNPASIFTSRDGFLSIAHRSNQFDGMDTQAIRNNKGELVAAICRVWRRDMTHPFTVEVALSEYASERNPLWKSKPETMLKKVAESQALRRAFDISGIYDPSEFDQVEQDHTPAPAALKPTPATAEQKAKSSETKRGFTPEEVLQLKAKAFHKAIVEADSLEVLKAIAAEIKRSDIPENHPLRLDLKQDYRVAETAFTQPQPVVVAEVTPVEAEEEGITPDQLETDCPRCGGLMGLQGENYVCYDMNCRHIVAANFDD